MDDYAFYVLVKRLEGEAVTEFFFGDNTNFGEAPVCSDCGRFVGARDWLPPYQVEIESYGNLIGDIAFGRPDFFLVSPRFKDIYVEGKLKGLSGFDTVQISSFKGGKKIVGEKPAYLKVDVFRGDTAIDPVASGDEWEGDPCPGCLLGNRLKRRRRIVIDEGTWSGEDIFFARGAPGQLIVSNRFKKVCEANGVTNAVMISSVHRR